VISPTRRRQAVEQVVGVLDVSELGQPRATQRYEKRQLEDKQKRIISLASQYGRYGYRRIASVRAKMPLGFVMYRYVGRVMGT